MTVRALAQSVVVVVAACAGRDAEVSDAGSLYINPDCAVEVDMMGCGTGSTEGGPCGDSVHCIPLADCGPTPTCECALSSAADFECGCQYEESGTFRVTAATARASPCTSIIWQPSCGPGFLTRA
jgi:hypothetical protein